jgi:hypothetical protein
VPINLLLDALTSTQHPSLVAECIVALVASVTEGAALGTALQTTDQREEKSSRRKKRSSSSSN